MSSTAVNIEGGFVPSFTMLPRPVENSWFAMSSCGLLCFGMVPLYVPLGLTCYAISLFGMVWLFVTLYYAMPWFGMVQSRAVVVELVVRQKSDII